MQYLNQKIICSISFVNTLNHVNKFNLNFFRLIHIDDEKSTKAEYLNYSAAKVVSNVYITRISLFYDRRSNMMIAVYIYRK